MAGAGGGGEAARPDSDGTSVLAVAKLEVPPDSTGTSDLKEGENGGVSGEGIDIKSSSVGNVEGGAQGKAAAPAGGGGGEWKEGGGGAGGGGGADGGDIYSLKVRVCSWVLAVLP